MRHLFLACMLAMLLTPLTVSAQNAPAGAEIYIIAIDEPGAIRYEGGLNGLKATAAAVRAKEYNKGAKPEIQAYRDHLDAVIDSYADQMSGTLGRTVEPLLRYHVTFAGMAVHLTADEANEVAALPGVLEVRKDVHYELTTDAGPQWIGADHIWDGSATPNSNANFGEGVVVGVLDTGVNMDHPSFSDSPSDGHTYVNPLGSGNFAGWCNPTNPNFDPSYVCNDKLIGAWDFADITSGGTETDGPEDSNGHGSHTASTAAGNFIAGPFTDGGTGNTFEAASISGVARHANLITYDVCVNTCPGSAIIGAVNQAILDGVDVFNFSISGGLNPWTDNDRSFLDAFGAGILPVASAGNLPQGDTDPTGDVGHRSPWTMTVANQTHNRVNSNPVSVVGGPPDLQDMYGLLGVRDNFTGDITQPIEWAGNIGDGQNFDGCDMWTGPYATDFTGSIVLISRGGCTFADKINFAAAANAVAVIVFNNQSIIPIVMGGIEATTIASLMIGQNDGEALRDHILANPVIEGSSVTVTMEAVPEYTLIDEVGSIINASSLRGPNNFDVTKPDIGGPGTNIFAAYADNIGPAPQFTFLSGTSMSSPHAAGSAALLMSIHPDWTPAEVKSALMMTANPGKNEAGDPGNPDIDGSGTVDLTEAALSGLIMDENFDNMLAADPATGGDPSTLNLPSMRSNDCNGTCSWTRTVCNATDEQLAWQVTPSIETGWTISADVGSISLLPDGMMQKTGFEDGEPATGSCATIEITASITDPALVTAGNILFGTVLFDVGGIGFADSIMTVAVVPTGVAP